MTFAIAIVVCYPKARALSYDFFEKWNSRRATAKTQLEDLTVQAIYVLQANLNAALGESAGGDELRFTVDPIQFQPAVLSAAKYYKLAANLNQAYQRGRKFAGLVPRTLELLFIVLVLFFVRLSWRRQNWTPWIFPTLTTLLVIAGTAAIVVYLAYQGCEGKLRAAVVAAEQGET